MDTAKYTAGQIANWFLAYNRQFEATRDAELLSNMNGKSHILILTCYT
jgi:hypothetical protein